jgi:gliding motility-associated-like protein
MGLSREPYKRYCARIFPFIYILMLNYFFAAAQKNNLPGSVSPVHIQSTDHTLLPVGGTDSDMFGIRGHYIQNVGQYGKSYAGCERMGNILYGYEGMGAPVLFTPKGLIHLLRNANQFSYEEMERRERTEKGKRGEQATFTEKYITIEWLNANPHPQIIAEEMETAYHVYGMLPQKAPAFKKIIYKELYPGIDVVYSFIKTDDPGYEFSLVVKPGASVAAVKMRYGGDVKSLQTDKEGNLTIHSDIGSIHQSSPVSFYSGKENNGKRISTSCSVKNNIVGFILLDSYDRTKEITIDPFVTATGNLTGGNNNGKARDIDFDYDGNIYVSGGGDATNAKLAKFDPAGVLLWTFSGVLAAPSWHFGNSYGGWVVDKATGSIFMGQGLMTNIGFSVVRLNTSGLYDGYISTPNSNFWENWKMIWSCNSGTPQIMIAGGGGNANNELALLAPPVVVPVTSNLSGLSGGHNDISDIVIDPVSNDMFTIYSIPVTGTPNDNIIYKHPPPYTSASIAWQRATGFFALREPSNRPYTDGLDNSSNTLAVNSTYLFYWDGKNLMAISKTTGATVGTPFVFAGNFVLTQGGVFADECNNVFVGNNNGTVKVFKFDGTVFNDAAAADITITGFPLASVYDMSYDNARSLLYVCGNGFVTSVDVAAYCPSTTYSISIVQNCINASITATLSPVPPVGTTITYILYDGLTQVATNTTGVFTGLTIGINYTLKVFLNQACSGTQVVKDFMLSGTPLLVINNPLAVCIPDGLVNITDASITAGSAPGLSLSYWLDALATVACSNPAAVVAGTYYIKAVTGGSPCPDVKPVIVPSLPVPVSNAGPDSTICFGQNAQLFGSGGVSYSWSPIIYLDDPLSANPRVINPRAGNLVYHLTVTDANGCHSIADEQVIITVTPPPKIYVPADTIIAFNQSLQLNVIDVNNSGLVNFAWLPVTGLNDPFIKNPVAILNGDIIYQVIASTASDCKAIAYVRVKVYKGPEIYVPSAFTANGDGLNDLLYAIPVGIKVFHYFSIYNRWGQLVFTTSNPAVGWDGKVQGVSQSSAVFVWMAEAVDYFGNLIKRKGTVTLLR